MKKFLLFIFCIAGLQAGAQTVADTTKKVDVIDTLKKDLLTAPDTVPRLRSKVKSLIGPGIAIGYGITSFYVPPLRRFDRWIYREAAEHNLSPKKHVEDYLQYTPVILTYGLNLVGVHGKNTFIDRSLIYLLSQGMLQITLQSVKNATHRLRPNGSDRLSFPSGHTGNAFANAEFMAQELSGKSHIYGYVGYALAITTGSFRVFHENHWFSDVIAGAGFGILSTKAAYLLYPIIRNRLTRDGRAKEDNREINKELQDIKDKKKKEHNTLLLPSYQQGALGLQFAMSF